MLEPHPADADKLQKQVDDLIHPFSTLAQDFVPD